MMVEDGMNLAAAPVSVSPISAARPPDRVLLGNRLRPCSRDRLFAQGTPPGAAEVAIGYNAPAVPIAIFAFVAALIAAARYRARTPVHAERATRGADDHARSVRIERETAAARSLSLGEF
ncbi:hypothetical protein [Bradyrhizobium sp. STM 3562]|uniref:hypothetical protein n=1 Tax=Bradyrhizobium sp. STM 3562 TaxID=578924 RepID=UPI00388EDEB5